MICKAAGETFNDKLADAEEPAASRTVAVSENAPIAVGVPVMVPAAAFSVSPAESCPLVMLQV